MDTLMRRQTETAAGLKFQEAQLSQTPERVFNSYSYYTLYLKSAKGSINFSKWKCE